MTALRRASLPLALTLALLGIGAPAAAANEAPVVFALDASRSLSAAESRAAADLAKELLAGTARDGIARTPGLRRRGPLAHPSGRARSRRGARRHDPGRPLHRAE